MLSDGLSLGELLTDEVVKHLPDKERDWFAEHPTCNGIVCKNSVLCRRLAAQRKFLGNHLPTSGKEERELRNYRELLLWLRLLLCGEKIGTDANIS